MFYHLSRWLGSKRSSRTSCLSPRGRCSLESLEDRLALSNFTQIDPPVTSDYPYSAMVRIAATFPDNAAGTYEQGSGSLIDNFQVLTAAHVLYDASLGGWATSVQVWAGESGGTSFPFGEAYGTYLHVVNTNWSASGDTAGDGDVGLIDLDRNLGPATGYLGFGYNSDNGTILGTEWNKTGYPGQSPGNGLNMYDDVGYLNGINTGSWTTGGYADQAMQWSTSQMSDIPGESGSPIYNSSDIAYGVNTAVSGTTGYGEEITEGIYNELVGWLGDAAPGNVSTSTSLSPSSVTATPGQTVTFTATVYGDDGSQPGGMVAFFNGSQYLGSSQLNLANFNGLTGTNQAQFSMPIESYGQYNIYAVYQGQGGETSSQAESVVNVPPQAPTMLNATAVSASQINVSWAFAPGATSYAIEQWSWATNSWQQIASVGGSANSYVVAGLSPNTQYYFLVGAVNSGGTTWATDYVSATTFPVLSITTSTLPNWDQNFGNYNQTLTATGGTGSLSYRLASGNHLPAGLHLHGSTGVITGRPTKKGTFTFSIIVQDSVGKSASQTFTMTINPPPAITTKKLPSGTTNDQYDETIATSGGTGAITFSVVKGSSLPPGLELSSAGTLSGTPTKKGKYVFKIEVTDSIGDVVIEKYTMSIT